MTMLNRLTGTATLVLAARIGGAVASVTILIVLSQTLPASDVGIFIAAQGCALLLATVGTLNMEALAIRIIPQNPPRAEAIHAFIRVSTKVALIGLPLAALGTILYVWRLGGEAAASLGVVIGLGSLVITAASLRVTSQWATAKGAVATAAIWPMLIRPLLFLSLLLVLSERSALTLTYTIWAAVFSDLAASLFPIIRINQRSVNAPDDHSSSLSHDLPREGVMLMLATIFLDRFPDVITVLAGSFLPEAQVAAIAISLRLALIIRMVTVSITMVISPQVSRAVGRNETDTILRLTDIYTLGASAAGLALVSLLMVFAGPILSIFGPDYTDATTTVRVLSLVGLVPAFFGPSLMVLVSSARTSTTLRATFIGTIVLVVACGLGAGLGGAVGFAVGVVLGQASWSFMLAQAVRRHADLQLALPQAAVRLWQRIQSGRIEST